MRITFRTRVVSVYIFLFINFVVVYRNSIVQVSVTVGVGSITNHVANMMTKTDTNIALIVSYIPYLINGSLCLASMNGSVIL
jgi:hypothetical protein